MHNLPVDIPGQVPLGPITALTAGKSIVERIPPGRDLLVALDGPTPPFVVTDGEASPAPGVGAAHVALLENDNRTPGTPVFLTWPDAPGPMRIEASYHERSVRISVDVGSVSYALQINHQIYPLLKR